ncbi:hypothetical protein C4A76_17360 [Brevibacillus laterosporus]|uniref:Uncharacterized protein n=1 Tax=Brevibacillus laterosporus TaxID=1465 RepID=A0AAP8U671_BRELA|nr:hypothetical protein C4A76_17360 [Brevibacillus laterosporus]PPB08662.1 hypothetical protein C4A77_07545 [Brevibacillus laterosporus]
MNIFIRTPNKCIPAVLSKAIYKEKSKNSNIAFSNLSYSEFYTLGELQPKKSRIPYYAKEPAFLKEGS